MANSVSSMSRDPESLRQTETRHRSGSIRKTLRTIRETAGLHYPRDSTELTVMGGVISDEPEHLPPSPNPTSDTRRPPIRRSTDFRRSSSSPESSIDHSSYFPRRSVSRLVSMTNQILVHPNAPSNDRDADALKNIWKIYAHEATEFDHHRITNLHRSLDVRLIFSGIFSAIVTPFIVESYKFCYMPGTQTFDTHLSAFGPGGWKVRVNTMWFGSLVMSLIAAGFSIHCKQWLDGYGVDLAFSGTASSSSEELINACRLRQYRYQGMEKYYISEIIGLQPILLYMALVFFCIGLIDFLWQINHAIAIFISIILGIVVIVYGATTIIPCFTTRSPFKTSLSNMLADMWRGLWQGTNPKGLTEHEEKLDVHELGDELDDNSLKWLMEHTQSEHVYQEALRAEREYRRCKSGTPVLPLFNTTPVVPSFNTTPVTFETHAQSASV